MRRAAATASRILLNLSSIILVAGAILHAFAYPKAAAAADQSTLPAFFQVALKGLWLSDSLSSLLLGLALAGIAARPRLAATPILLLLALTPFAQSLVLFSTVGNFIGSYLMMSAAACALLGTALRPTKTSDFARRVTS
jgi:hypothetical protein